MDGHVRGQIVQGAHDVLHHFVVIVLLFDVVEVLDIEVHIVRVDCSDEVVDACKLLSLVLREGMRGVLEAQALFHCL